jgi:hypothetical protein
VHDALGPGTTIAKTQGKRPAAPPPQMRFAAGVTGTDAGTGTGHCVFLLVIACPWIGFGSHAGETQTQSKESRMEKKNV